MLSPMWGKLAPAAALAVAMPVAAYMASPYIYQGPEPDRPGCSRFVPVDQALIAHGGGGLPEESYSNSLRALNLAAAHGFTMIEIDFMVRDRQIVIQHDKHPPSELTVPDLMAWMRKHPDIYIVTDFKADGPLDNVAGLELLRAFNADVRHRIIPQIYKPEEYEPVRKMGYPAPILTLYRTYEGREPVETINSLDLRAVTMPVERAYLAEKIDHPVYLHTVNEPMPGFGLYTDCLIPA